MAYGGGYGVNPEWESPVASLVPQIGGARDFVMRGAAVSVGVYLAKNLGAILTSVLPGVAATVDGVRPGLSRGAMEGIGALIAGYGVNMIGSLSAEQKTDIALGSAAIATSDIIASIAGQVDLIGGSPNFSNRVTGSMGMSAAPKLPATAGGLSTPQYTNQATLLMPPSSPAGNTTQLLGVGTTGL